jgi:hypothetical protein
MIDTADSFTASAWVSLNSLSGYQTVVSIAGNTVAGFFLQLRGDTGSFAFARLSSDATGAATIVSAASDPVRDSHHRRRQRRHATITLYEAMGTRLTSGWRRDGDTDRARFYNGTRSTTSTLD